MSNAADYRGTSKEGTLVAGTQYYTNKVTVRGLMPETTYYSGKGQRRLEAGRIVQDGQS